MLDAEGYKRVRMGFSLSHSATLDLIEPTRWGSDSGKYLNNWGPGPYYIRISVHGLAAKAEQLSAAGTPYTLDEDNESVGGALLRVDPDALDGAIVELVEHRA
jgi:hypothetical protein